MKSLVLMQILLTFELITIRISSSIESCNFGITTNLLNHTKNGIETIPEVNALKLKIFNGNLPLINRSTFKQYRNLKKLAVINSNLTQIGRGAFIDLAHLTEMDLRNNSLKSFTSDLFSKNNSLKKLVLSGNMLESLTGFRFNKMNELDVSNNNLKRLPGSIRGRRSLQILDGNNPYWQCQNLSSYSDVQKKICSMTSSGGRPVAMMNVETGEEDSGCNFMLCMYWMIGAIPCGIFIGNTWAIIKCFQRCCCVRCRRNSKETKSVGVQYEKVDYDPPPK